MSITATNMVLPELLAVENAARLRSLAQRLIDRADTIETRRYDPDLVYCAIVDLGWDAVKLTRIAAQLKAQYRC